MLPLVMLGLVGGMLLLVLLTGRNRHHPARKARDAATAQEFIALEGIRRQMLCVGPGRYRAVIEVEPTNVGLLDVQEVNAMLAKWRSLLMALRHPIQIYIGSQRLDPQEVVAALDARMAYLTGNRRIYAETLRAQLWAYTAADALLVKRCYIVVVWDEARVGPVLAGTAEDMAARDLGIWCRTIMDAFRSMGLRARRLDDNELAQLLYAAWLRDRARFTSLRDLSTYQPEALWVTGAPLHPDTVPLAPGQVLRPVFDAPHPAAQEEVAAEDVALPTR